jgi:hypothetical protein
MADAPEQTNYDKWKNWGKQKDPKAVGKGPIIAMVLILAVVAAVIAIAAMTGRFKVGG